MRGVMTTSAVVCTAALLIIAACDNAGADRVIGVGATGLVRGTVVFDMDGAQVRDVNDVPLSGVAVRLISRGTRDTVANVSTDAAGLARFPRVPVGTYNVLVSDTRWADTIGLVRHDSAQLTVHPDDSLEFSALVSYPKVTVAAARTLPEGRKVFVEGVVLNNLGTFGDASVHLGATSGSLRATRVRQRPFFVADSVRALGTRRATDGQPTLDDVTIFLTGTTSPPLPLRLATAVAAVAEAGLRDAALVKVVDARITDTVTVAGDYHITATDGSGPLVIVFDADAGLTRTLFVPRAIVDFTGVLVPSGTGSWRLKPRANADVVFKAMAPP